jgi:hypothetical protein
VLVRDALDGDSVTLDERASLQLPATLRSARRSRNVRLSEHIIVFETTARCRAAPKSVRRKTNGDITT